MDRKDDLAIAALETIQALVVVLDTEGRITFFNKACETLTGFSSAEVLGRPIWDMLVPRTCSEHVKQVFQDLVQGKLSQGAHSQSSWLTKDGQERLIAWCNNVLRDGSGVVAHVISTGIDVTERQWEQEALRRSEELYRGLVEAIGGAVVRVDREGRRTFVSNLAASMAGRSVDDLMKGRFGDTMVPEERERAWELLRSTFQSGRPVYGFVTKQSLHGRARYVSANWVPIRDTQGNVVEVQMTSFDITEQVEVGEKFRQSQEVYRSLVESLGGWVVRVDRDGRLSFVSSTAEAFTGRSRNQLVLGRFGDMLASASERKRARALLRETFRTGKPVRGLVTRQVLHGKERYVSANWEPIRDAQGNVVEVQITSFDITEQMEAQERLRRSEELYRGVVELTEAGVARCDLEGRRTFVNETLARRLGASVEELLKGVAGDRTAPEHRAREERAFRTCIETGQPVRGVISRHDVQGRRLWTRADYTPLLDASGKVSGCQITSIDVTDLIQAQELVRQSEEFYRSLMNNVAAGVVRVDRQGRRIFANRFAAEMFGRRLEEFASGTFVDVLIPEEQERANRLLKEVFETGKPVRGFVTQHKVGGETRYVSSSWEPIRNAQGDIVEVQITSIDVTEQRRLQEQFLQAQKMESVGRLAGSVAHDFNNLLTAINGYAELAATSLPKDSPALGYVEEVRQAGQRAATLTNQLLAFSRRHVLSPQVVDLNQLIVKMDRMLRRLIGADVQMSLRLAPDLARVKVDPGLMEQVLVNLVVNARDAMPKGGSLAIETRNTTLAGEQSALPTGPYVVVSVADTGVGMDDEVKQHLFEPFFTTKPQGTGLGLATCYNIVKQSYGEIRIQSQPGKGTTVEVYLPACLEVQAAVPEEPALSAVAGGDETILLAEDSLPVRNLAAKVLRGLGYVVLDATNGTEALRLVQKDPDLHVDLLLADVVMPRMGGIELAQRLAELRPGVGVILTSGYPEEAAFPGGKVPPRTWFLRKPFSPVALAQKVREVLDS